jgi:predicted DNA-binding transcriptional regulator YafY
MRIDRMLSIVITLLQKEKISARELAGKFDVSVRTVYRDIEAINRAGIPITTSAGSSGGIGLMDTFKLDRRLLTMEDFIYILSSLKGINETMDNKEIESAIDKISSLLPKDKSGLVDSQMEQIVFDMIPWGYAKKQTQKVKVLHQALINKQLIEFHYTGPDGKAGKRTVEPVTLVFKGSTWYLFGYCKKRSDYRTFRLSRINDLVVLPGRFAPRGVSYKEFSQKNQPPEKLIRYILRFQPNLRQVVDDYFDEKKITVQKEGTVIVNGMFPEGDWFISWLLSYGDKVEVVEPESAKKALLAMTKKIFKLYNADTTVS